MFIYIQIYTRYIRCYQLFFAFGSIFCLLYLNGVSVADLTTRKTTQIFPIFKLLKRKCPKLDFNLSRGISRHIHQIHHYIYMYSRPVTIFSPLFVYQPFSFHENCSRQLILVYCSESDYSMDIHLKLTIIHLGPAAQLISSGLFPLLKLLHIFLRYGYRKLDFKRLVAVFELNIMYIKNLSNILKSYS